MGAGLPDALGSAVASISGPEVSGRGGRGAGGGKVTAAGSQGPGPTARSSAIGFVVVAGPGILKLHELSDIIS